MDPTPGEVTRLLIEIKQGKQDAAAKLMPLVYKELRRIALQYMRAERPGNNTLQATALVHEAYLRLVGYEGNYQNQGHFLAVAARAMRRILVDQAKGRRAAKRGGQQLKVPLEEAVQLSEEQCEEILDLNGALDRLAALDPRQCQIVEMRYFAGLTEEETAEALDLAPKTVQREWRSAQAWLYGQLTGGTADDSGTLGSH